MRRIQRARNSKGMYQTYEHRLLCILTPLAYMQRPILQLQVNAILHVFVNLYEEVFV